MLKSDGTDLRGDKGTRWCLSSEEVVQGVNVGLVAGQRWQEVRPLHLPTLPLPHLFQRDEQGRQLDNFDTISCT